jgi:hypothetical protein
MGAVHELPGRRDSYADDRGDGRRMQVTWHPERGVVVLSLWHRHECTATFQLPIDEAGPLIAQLATSLGEAAASHASLDERTGRSVG